MNIIEYLNLCIQENDPIKRVVKFKGVPISIEWNKGEVREFPGSPYHNLMHYDYGFIEKTSTPDGEELDICLGDDPNQDTVFLLTQLNAKTGRFDEFKYCLGFKDEKEIEEKYKKSLEPRMFGGVTPMSWEDFKKNHLKFYKDAVKEEVMNIRDYIFSHFFEFEQGAVVKGNNTDTGLSIGKGAELRVGKDISKKSNRVGQSNSTKDYNEYIPNSVHEQGEKR